MNLVFLKEQIALLELGNNTIKSKTIILSEKYRIIIDDISAKDKVIFGTVVGVLSAIGIGSLVALSILIPPIGIGASVITSSLAGTGAIVGGGMVAGVSVIAGTSAIATASVVLTTLAGIKLYDAHDIIPILNKMDLTEIYQSKLKNGDNVIYDGSWKCLQYHGCGTLYFGRYNLTGNFIDGKLYGRFIVCVDNIRIMSGIMLDGDIIEE